MCSAAPRPFSLANEAVARAEQLGDSATLAEALHVAGTATVLSGHNQERGFELLERARDAADDAGHSLVSALVAIELARGQVGLLAGVPTAREATSGVTSLLSGARTRLRRLGSPLRPMTELASVEAAWLIRSGDAASSLEVLSDALNRLVEVQGEDATERVPLLLRRALTRAQVGEIQAAVTDSGDAVAILVARLGAEHPGTAQALDFHRETCGLQAEEPHSRC